MLKEGLCDSQYEIYVCMQLCKPTLAGGATYEIGLYT